MKEKLAQHLAHSRIYTHAVAEAMPEKLYATTPVAGTWTFGELLHHIAYGIRWWEANFIRGAEEKWAPPSYVADKTTIRAELDTAYDGLERTLGEAPDTAKIADGFYATLDHITHHRAQAIIHLRSQGLAAPEYVY